MYSSTANNFDDDNYEYNDEYITIPLNYKDGWVTINMGKKFIEREEFEI